MKTTVKKIYEIITYDKDRNEKIHSYSNFNDACVDYCDQLRDISLSEIILRCVTPNGDSPTIVILNTYCDHCVN